MSPVTRDGGHRVVWPLLWITLIAVLAAVAVWSWRHEGSQRVGDGSRVNAPKELSRSAGPVPETSPTPGGLVDPEIVKWGGHDRQVSVLIENGSQREIVSARALVTALDRDGAVVASTTGNARTTCCTVLSLRPDGRYGLFLDLPRGRTVEDVADVTVRLLDVRSRSAQADDAPWISHENARLTRSSRDTVVTVRLASHGGTGPVAVGQAFLVDADERLVGVISGRFYCFGGPRPRTVRMQLGHPTPPGTRIEKVVVVPAPASAASTLSHRCPRLQKEKS